MSRAAQAPGEPIDLGIVERIREEGLNRSHIPDDLRHLSDVIGPRLTGSPAMDLASAWAANKMREYGLDAVHMEGWHFGRGWEELYYAGRMTAPFVKPLHGAVDRVGWPHGRPGSRRGGVRRVAHAR